MKGSEKQIKWAEDIKKKIIGEITDCYLSDMDREFGRPEKIAAVEAAVERLTAIESAKWWIEASDNGSPIFLRYAKDNILNELTNVDVNGNWK